MTCVSDHMKVTWICRFCGAVNPTSSEVCGDCSTAYTSVSVPREPANQVLNQGVIFNTTINPEPDWNEVMHTLDRCYPEEEKEEETPVQDEKPYRESFGMRLFAWTASILMWVAIIICTSIFAFFVYVFVSVFIKIAS